MKRALLINSKTNENSFGRTTSRNIKLNNSIASSDASMMPMKGRSYFKHKSISIQKESRTANQSSSNSVDSFDLHGHLIQITNSYSFIVDWQL
jgi:hypothetical protein